MVKKYKELFDNEFLRNQYLINKKSCPEIAAMVGCSKDAVRLALIRNNIILRTNSQSQKLLIKRSKYELLNNKELLAKLYSENNSTIKIAKLAGAKTCNSARQALIRFDIKLKNISDGLTSSSSKNDFFILNNNVIIGSLLGDGGLSRYNRFSEESYPKFYKKNKFCNHIEFVAKSIFAKNYKDRIKKEFRYGNIYFTLSSFVHKELLYLDDKWYTKDNIKVVPTDISLNKEIMLHWFLDDGSTSWRIDRKTVRLTLCSESFTKDEQLILCEKIRNEFGLLATIRKTNSGTGYRIHISENYVNDFLDLIGPCPVPELSYKWKFQRRKEKENV